jgi:hypothetical protein
VRVVEEAGCPDLLRLVMKNWTLRLEERMRLSSELILIRMLDTEGLPSPHLFGSVLFLFARIKALTHLYKKN